MKSWRQPQEAVRYAKSFTDNVEFSAEDGSRSDPDFLCKVFEAAIAAGATTVNLPDTVGYAIPSEFAEMVTYVMTHTPNIHQAVLSVHCHNDLGLATANTLAAIAAGARQAEVTINGIGERAGNTSMEEVVMAMRTRGNYLPMTTNIKTEHIYPTSRLVSMITGIIVQPNKAIVGANAFAHEAGIHQDGMLKNPMTYEIMRPETIGLSTNKLVLGKHSGRHALREHLKDLGYDLSDEELAMVFKKFKALADKKETRHGRGPGSHCHRRRTAHNRYLCLGVSQCQCRHHRHAHGQRPTFHQRPLGQGGRLWQRSHRCMLQRHFQTDQHLFGIAALFGKRPHGRYGCPGRSDRAPEGERSGSLGPRIGSGHHYRQRPGVY